MQQVHNRGNFDLDEDAYFAIIRGKTAELTAVSCRLGAHYAGAAEATVEALERYGRDLGVAFQIADDVLDIWGEERTTGKSLGTDLEKQKLTLPLIRLLATAPPGRPPLRSAPARRGPSRSARTAGVILTPSDALEYSWNRAKSTRRTRHSALDGLSESNAKSVLRSLTHYVVRRSS